LKGKTLFITGASRGIGLAIALRAARDGANIVIAAKTDKPHPKLPGTIYTAAEEIVKAGGRALPLIVDIRFEDQIVKAIKRTIDEFGGIDIVINNASAISLTDTFNTSTKVYDLMNQINMRGTFLTSKLCLPYLLKSKNPHILNISPPLSMLPQWFSKHVAYTMAKYGMSMCVLGMAEEFKGEVGVNALWPLTSISTAAVKNIVGGEDMIQRSRTPEIMAEAAYYILTSDCKTCTGNFFVDEQILRLHGIKNFDRYLTDKRYKNELQYDFFLEDELIKRVQNTKPKL